MKITALDKFEIYDYPIPLNWKVYILVISTFKINVQINSLNWLYRLIWLVEMVELNAKGDKKNLTKVLI